MKILLDANISYKLTKILTPVYGECTHVDYIDLEVPVEDIDIWDYALENEFVIITKDNDFVDLMDLKGFPPKVVLLKTGNNSSRSLAELLINAKQNIVELVNSNLGLLEIVNKNNM